MANKLYLLLMLFCPVIYPEISLAQASTCYSKFSFDAAEKLTEVSISTKGCRASDLEKIAKILPLPLRPMFQQSSNNNVHIEPQPIQTRCDMGFCIPCSVNKDGRCDTFTKIPDSFLLISMQSPGVSLAQEHHNLENKNQQRLGVAAYSSAQENPNMVFTIKSGGDSISRGEIEQATKLDFNGMSFSKMSESAQGTGGLIQRSWDVLVKGRKPVDERAEQSLLKERQALQQIFQRGLAEVHQATEDTLEMGKKVQNSFHLSHETSMDALSSLSQQVASASARVADLQSKLDSSIILLSEVSKLELDAAAKSKNELEQIRSGLLPTAAYQKIILSFREKIANGSPSELARDTSQLAGMVASSAAKPALAEQYKNALRSFTDSNGLVQSWAGGSGVASGLTLATDEFSPVGRAIRQNLNEALGLIVQGSTKSGEIAPEYALDMILSADKLLASGDHLQGNRLLNQSRALLDFARGDARVNRYHELVLKPAAKALFRLSDTFSPASGFQNYQFKIVANKFAAIPASEFHDNGYMAMQLAVRELASTALQADAKIFNRALAIAYAVYDFQKGLGRGVVGGVTDTVSGMVHIVAHPIDTAKGLANLVLNYEDTFDMMMKAVIAFVEHLPEAGPEEYGKITGRLAVEIASGFVGAGIVKQGIEAVALSRTAAVMEAAEQLAPHVRKVVDSAKKWDSVESLLHVAKGNYQIAADGSRKLVSGMHTKLGFENFLKLNQNAGKTFSIQNVTEFTAERIEASGSILSQTLDNGVRKIQLPRDAWANGDAFNKAIAYTEAGQKVKGVKTLFPETWDLNKITEATEAIKNSVSLSREGNVITGVYERVNVRIFLEETTGKVVTAYPFWRQ